jgi:hypothetical protein
VVVLGISLKSVYNKLDKIANTSSTNEKIELLQEYLQNQLFRKVVWCAYTQTIKFNVKVFPPFKPIGFNDRGFEFVLPILKQLNAQNGADNSIKQRLFQAASIDKETYEVVARICDGDLKCGIGARTINKAVPNTIKIYSYERSATSKYISNIRFTPRAIAQCKADGAFANLLINRNRTLKYITRNGIEIFQLDHLIQKILSQPSLIQYGAKRGIVHSSLGNYFGKVVMGELRVYNPDGTIMNRKAGNGLIRECQLKTLDPKIAKRIFFTAWNCVDIDDFWNGYSAASYGDRFYDTSTFVNIVKDEKWIRLIESDNVTCMDEVYVFHRRMRAKNEEGTVVKNVDAPWEDNQSGSHDSIKIKHSFEVDVKVLGWNYGKKGTRFEKCMGSVIIGSECGLMKCNVSGFTDEEREWNWDMMVGTIITCEAESIITSKSKDTVSLYTPSYLEIRTDKTKANTLKEMIEIAEESKKTRRRKS